MTTACGGWSSNWKGCAAIPPPVPADRLRDFLDWSLEELRRIIGEAGGGDAADEVWAPDFTPLVALAHELRRDAGRPEAPACSW